MIKTEHRGVMLGWQLLRLLPKAWAEQLAGNLAHHPQTLRRWARRPASDEYAFGTGARNVIDLVDIIFDWALIWCRPYCVAFVEHYIQKMEAASKQDQGNADEFQRRVAEVERRRAS